MQQPYQMSKTAILVEGALLCALAFALSLLPSFSLPFGGSVSLFATLPILIMSFRHSTKWGLCTAGAYSVLQAFQGMGSILLCKTALAMLACALLDYVLAYTCLALAGPVARRFKSRSLGIAAGVLFTGLLRLTFSFISGMLLWYQWAPQGVPVWRYSLGYNASWCLPDVALVLGACLLLARLPQLGMLPQKK